MGSSLGSCIACGAELVFLGRQNSYDHGSCTACRSIQVAPLPSVEDVLRAYQHSQYSKDNSHGQGDGDAVRKSSRPHYDCIKDALKSQSVSGSVLDYGAGWGGLVEVLRKSGFDASGLEMSQGMVEECRKRGLPIRAGDFSTVKIPDASLGAVTMCGVFEHLLTPDHFLDQVHAALNKDGLFISLQPTAPFARLLAKCLRFGSDQRELPKSFYVFDPPWHVALLSLTGMRKLTERHGFELLDIRPVPQGSLPGWTGVLQAVVNQVNKAGWAVARTYWPLMVSHLFIFRKVS